MEKITIKPHTVITLIGPTGSGKSYFSLKLKETLNQNYPLLKVSIISSDEIRRDLLGENLSRYHEKMLQVSEQAFNLLFSKLEALTTYPVNNEIVIVDTTGLNESFRKKIIEISNKNNYNSMLAIFDFKQRSEYSLYMEETNSSVLHRQIKILHEEVLPKIGSKNYYKIVKIKSKDQLFDFEISNYELYKKCHLDSSFKYSVIGDIHNCYEELVSLLKKLGHQILDNKIIPKNNNDKVILVGDLIDKGPDPLKVLSLVKDNLDFFTLILGNHENFVWNYFNNPNFGGLNLDPKMINKNFSSIKEKEIKEKLNEIWNYFIPFAKHEYFIVTHAPCENKFLGKLDDFSLKNQRNFYFEKKQEDFPDFQSFQDSREKELFFIEKESNKSHPYHFFGHVPVCNLKGVKNNYFTDGGCVEGGKLYSFSIRNRNLDVNSVPSTKETKEKLLNLFSKKQQISEKPNYYDSQIEELITNFVSNKVNFISGTISPADKKDFDLESLESGLNYYKIANQSKVILQPKYMGSRGNLYLFKDSVEKSYLISRTGNLINKTKVQKLIIEQHKKFLPLMEKDNLKLIIIDGEVLPWSLIGQDLIKNSFEAIPVLVKQECDFLKKTGFEEKIEELFNLYESSKDSFLLDKKTLNSLELEKKHKYGSTFNEISHLELTPTNEEIEGALNFKKQLDIYAKKSEDSSIDFKPFKILKKVLDSGEELNCLKDGDNTECFSEEPHLIVDFSNPLFLEEALSFFNNLTINQGFEGIVIKPLKTNNSNLVPFIKVRNPNYLTIIYGHNYKSKLKYDKILNQKNIKGKLKRSMKEFNLAKKLLDIPYEEININNDNYKTIILEFFNLKKGSESEDPRL